MSDGTPSLQQSKWLQDTRGCYAEDDIEDVARLPISELVELAILVEKRQVHGTEHGEGVGRHMCKQFWFALRAAQESPFAAEHDVRVTLGKMRLPVLREDELWGDGAEMVSDKDLETLLPIAHGLLASLMMAMHAVDRESAGSREAHGGAR